MQVSLKEITDAGITDLPIIFQDSDGEKSDDLVVDVSNEVSIAACSLKWLVDMHRVRLCHMHYNPLLGFSRILLLRGQAQPTRHLKMASTSLALPRRTRPTAPRRWHPPGAPHPPRPRSSVM